MGSTCNPLTKRNAHALLQEKNIGGIISVSRGVYPTHRDTRLLPHALRRRFVRERLDVFACCTMLYVPLDGFPSSIARQPRGYHCRTMHVFGKLSA